MFSDPTPTPTRTSISDRMYPRFTYQRTPTAIMPMPTIPERVILPEPGVHDIFDVRVAIDDTTESAAFSVRWEVYCRELGFEPADRFPDHCEHDAADLRSVQVVAYHRGSGQPAGCYRLLMADPIRSRSPPHSMSRRLVHVSFPEPFPPPARRVWAAPNCHASASSPHSVVSTLPNFRPGDFRPINGQQKPSTGAVWRD